METLTEQKSLSNQVPQTELILATFGERFAAAFVDSLIVNIPTNFFVFFFINPFIRETTNISEKLLLSLLALFIFIAVNLGYFGAYAYYRNGQTIVKRWNNIKVVKKDGTDLSLVQFLWRAFISRGIVYVGYFFLGNIANNWFLTYLLALRKNRLALHDKIVGTQVIKYYHVS